jgi:hypothetical protein
MTGVALTINRVALFGRGNEWPLYSPEGVVAPSGRPASAGPSGPPANPGTALSLVRGDERHDRMDKKNDDSCKHRQRDSFVDGRAANHCNAFHSFPHPDGSASSRRAVVTLRCFGERVVKRPRYGCESALVASGLLESAMPRRDGARSPPPGLSAL